MTVPDSTMRAAILTGPGRIEMHEIPRPFPKADEALIRVESCGVCASNVAPFEGRPWFSYPFEPGAPGHEACGRIETLGQSVTGWRIGDRVVFLSSHGFAEYDVAKTAAMIAWPPQFDCEQIPAEPIGCVMNILRRSEIKPGMTVAVVGIGFLGTLLIQLAKQGEPKCWRSAGGHLPWSSRGKPERKNRSVSRTRRR
jgi:threonine dehydrogenase-like Zn-dependent dehydrogenase